VNASKGCRCKMAGEKLQVYQNYWEFTGPMARVLYENVVRLVSFGIHGLFYSYDDVGGMESHTTSYLRQFGMKTLNDDGGSDEDLFVFSLKSPEAQSILMIFVFLLALCSGCFLIEYYRIMETVVWATGWIFSYVLVLIQCFNEQFISSLSIQ
ncbi:unnamed protein product, partial [Allacma fusca]